MVTITEMKTKPILAIGYLAFVVVMTIALFVSRTKFAPYLVFEYLVVLFPSDTRWGALFAILALGIVGGLLVGVLFGVILGSIGVTRPVAKAFWIGVGTVVLTIAWLTVVRAEMPNGSASQWWSMLIEALTLVVALCLSAGITDRLTKKLRRPSQA